MSQPDELSPPPQSQASLPAAPPRRAGRLWLQVGLAVVLLGVSAGARAWQSHRVDEVLREGRVAPFPLKSLPYTIANWDGVDIKVDPEIVRITGATDIVSRTYSNKTTGQRVTLLFLFGPSTGVANHSPEICYPSTGFRLLNGPEFKSVTAEEKKGTWPFFASAYSRGEGGSADTREVFWTWRYDGRWTPTLLAAKGFERIPGMFKVHVDRPIRTAAEMEQLDVGNPCKEFLGVLMPVIDRMIAESGSAAARSTSPVGSTLAR